jgi:cyclase
MRGYEAVSCARHGAVICALAFSLPLSIVGCGAAMPPEPPPMPSPIPVFPGPRPKATSAPEPPPPGAEKYADVVVKAEKVAGNVYVLFGAGGNIAVSVGEDGIVLVDDQFAPLAPKIKDALQGISDKPVRVVLNTHWHGDHTGGNGIFGRSAAIVAHENVRKRMVVGAPKTTIAGEPRPARPPAPREALPIVTFADKVSVHLNGEEIRAIHVAPGHTDGDVMVHFTRSGVVHMGDDFVTYGFPFVDLSSGGSVKGIIAAMRKAVQELPRDVKVIPGHGKISTLADVSALADKIEDCVKIVDRLVKQRKTLEQIRAQKPLARYDDLGKGFMKTDDFLGILFDELTKKKTK